MPTFLFGALTFGSTAEQDSAVTLNYDLVVSQFTAEGGLEIGGVTHLPVGVVCEVADDGDLDRTLDHLTITLGARALLTPLRPAELKRSFERSYRANGVPVFMLSPFASTPLLAAIDDDGLLWHLQGPPSDLALTYLPLLERVRQHLSAELDDSEPGALRVALLGSRDAEDVEIISYLDNALRAGTPQRARELYRRYILAEPQVDGGQSYVDALIDLFAFRPHIIVAVEGDGFVRNVLRVLEGAWAQAEDGQPKPFYVLSHHQAGSLVLSGVLARYPDLAARIVGVAPRLARDTELYDRYLSELESRNRGRARLDDTAPFYDAAYFLLYAAAASGEPAGPSARGMAAGMQRLLGGKSFAMGEAEIPAVLSELRKPRATIALQGTLGAPDFDATTGTRRRAEGSVWCVRLEREAGAVFEYDQLALDDANDTLVGELGCIPGF